MSTSLESRLNHNIGRKAIDAIVTIAASLIQLAIITRAYSSNIVGEYQLILALLFFVSAFSCFGGIAMVAAREMAQKGPQHYAATFSSALVLQLVVALVLCGLALAYFNAFHPALAVSLAIGTVSLLASLVLQVSQTLLIAKELIGKVVIASIFGHVAATAGIYVAALQGLSVPTLVGAWALFNFVQGVALVLLSRAWQYFSLRAVQTQILRNLISEVIPVVVMVVATHLYVRIDVVMLNYFAGETTVAHYSAGYLFLDQLMIMSNFMIGALFPNFARTTITGGREYKVLYRGILSIFCRYLFPLALGIALFPKQLLSIFYGHEYAAGALSLSILMLAAVFAWINGPSGTIFLSLKKQHLYMWATLVSLAVNILGNLILIPQLGANGAALSTVLTEFALCSYCLYWIYKETGYLPWMRIDEDART